MTLFDAGGSTAVISDDELYRYELTRSWPMPHIPFLDVQSRGTVVFVMLNPSTADASIDDPTIRRCIGFAKREWFSELVVVNLYALRATKPEHLLHHPDPFGPLNDGYLTQRIFTADLVVAAWGAKWADLGLERADVEDMARAAGKELVCLGMTAFGHPRHPLYVKGEQPFVEFSVLSFLSSDEPLALGANT